MSKAVPVKCWCGWRSRRAYRSCECDWPCHCTGFGRCPKCGYHVNSVQRLREMAENDSRYDVWANSPDGREALAKVIQMVGVAPAPNAAPNGGEQAAANAGDAGGGGK
jgi:hypothetical protein